MKKCNQCNRIVHDGDIVMGFNAGHGPVYICHRCKSPATFQDIVSGFDEFFEMAEDIKRKSDADNL